ncbi:ABC transporter ATP-binding protein [Spiroplasma monobiae]|uniref:ABC transporter ATP-binding protein n=1 Tax=Spiroplasma monobiae MQ-1 TaxID=1336748 RepID=A0A2K9LXQ8_SPISQ|nr:ABC transporter ATP-binding protein [Spiroplasma monobiae]AUM62504.1 ABC transporter ATP-binding protein [Spiroplasma monobiae MQ-1]
MIKINKMVKLFKEFNLSDINLIIEKGDLIALVGDNGAGKTTLIKSIFGMVELNSGKITFNDENIFDNNNLSRIAFFPDSNNIPLNITVENYMKYISIVAGVNQKEFNSRVDKIIEMLEIQAYKNKTIKKLSAGMKKRAIMAGVLITKPEFIIFDEPTANLDVEGKNEFLSIIKKLHESNVGMMITSHIIEELQDLCNKLIILKEGSIIYNNKFDNKKESIKNIYFKYIDKKENKYEGVKDIYE